MVRSTQNARAMESQGVPLEQIARVTSRARNDARIAARNEMSAADKAALEIRDLNMYGSRNGPSWGWVVENARAKTGLEGDGLYRFIIGRSHRSNAAVDRAVEIMDKP